MREHGNAQRHGDEDRQPDRDRHQQKMLAREPAEVGAEELGDEAARIVATGSAGLPAHATLRQKIARDHVEGDALQLGTRVHRDHGALVDAAFEFLQRGPGGRPARGDVEPVQHHCVVAREVAAVVGQHAQAEVVDLGVGGVDVDDVDLLRRDRVVSQAMVQPGGLLREAVARGQALPAIGAADEFVGQAQPQIGMARQVAEGANAEPIGIGRAHGERVAVVEAQRNRDAEAERCERGVHRLGRHGLRVLEDLQRHRAGVFGVQIDAARAQGLVDDGGVPQALPEPGRGRQMGRGGLRQHLGQDVGLGEALGPDVQARVLRLRGCRCAEQAQEGQGEKPQVEQAMHPAQCIGVPRTWPHSYSRSCAGLMRRHGACAIVRRCASITSGVAKASRCCSSMDWAAAGARGRASWNRWRPSAA
ncbi:hypothetical protein APY03_5998 [Variovorax sp. WDL1]|nr:hypothetical protein APY03_5998 [Variovorax sp. WDL1]